MVEKSRFLYIIGPEQGPQKIGISKDPKKRLTSIQTGHPEKLYLHYTKEVPEGNVRALERIIHRTIGHYKTINEWFDIPVEDAKAEIDFAFIRYNDEDNLSGKIKQGLIKYY